MVRPVPQLALDLQRPVPNEAAARVLHCLRACFPPGALDPMYRRITDARFQGTRAIADMVLFDGTTATCNVPATGTPGMRWENATGMWAWDDRRKAWKRDLTYA